MPTEATWRHWLERLYNLRRDKRGTYERPHKPVLLLAILDLLDRGLLTKNEVPLSPDLVKVFKRYFAVVRKHNDQPTIQNPFFHLSGDKFWHLVPISGAGQIYREGATSGAPSVAQLRRRVAYGRFDDGLWELLSEPVARHQLREVLIARYFPEQRENLAAICGDKSAARTEEALHEEPPGRDSAFRHTVLEIYDYRCAACGIRVKLYDDLSLVEAAHIIPFGESRNDKPDNGLALCPNHHWAMDRFLIAPCPHSEHRAGIWRVGTGLDARIDGQKDLVALANHAVIPPNDKRFYPAIECLRWREKRLSAKY